MSPSAVVQQVYLISFLKWEQIPLLPTMNNMSLQSYFISEGMEFEPRWLLLFHQSAAADRRGDHPLYRAGTTGHRICTTAGNDCVIRPQEHTQPCTDTLRQTPLIQYTSSQRFPWGIWIHWLPEWLILLPIPQKSITISFPVLNLSAGLSDWRFAFMLKEWEQNKKYHPWPVYSAVARHLPVYWRHSRV